MEPDYRVFSSWAARRYFGVDSRNIPHADDNQNQHEDVPVGTQIMDVAEINTEEYHPQVQQAVSHPCPCLNVLGIRSEKVCCVVNWKKIDPVDEMGNDVAVQPRHGHKAVAFKDLMIVFSGGNEGIFEEMNVYNTATNRWFKAPLRGEVPPGKASYGAAIDGHRLLIYGGMEEERVRSFSDTLYECNLQTWEWKLMRPSGHSPNEKPDGRFGHSFTEIDGRIFMFGGFGMSTDEIGNLFEDWKKDLFILYPKLNEQQGLWEKPMTFGNQPWKRESHAAVAYVSKSSGNTKLVIFGGTCDVRLGDIHSLDVNTMMWTEIEINFTPRSLHTATLVGNRVYIFGGWLARNGSKSESGQEGDDADQFLCFNLASMSWETACHIHAGGNECLTTETPIAPARVGHSAVAINERIYVWSGKYGNKRENGRQICMDDFWMLDVTAEQVPIYIPRITTQQITPDTNGQLPLPFDLSLVKNERLSPEPPDVEQDMLSQMPMSPSRDFVAEFINAMDAEVVHEKEQQNEGAHEAQEFSATSETGQMEMEFRNGIPEQTQDIYAITSTPMMPVPFAVEFVDVYTEDSY